MSTINDGLTWSGVVYDIPLPKKQRKALAAAKKDGGSTSSVNKDVEKVASSDGGASQEHLNVETPEWMKGPEGERRLLCGLKGHVARGEMVGMLGASGAGKTTALNILSARLGSKGTLKGDVLFDGKPRDPSKWKRLTGYVEQDDVAFTNLSVMETLTFAAKLRLPRSVYSAEEKARRVEDTLDMLRLEKCRDTKIGDSGGQRGISGGERKRTSIATELVSDVSLLLLDEPTSGLDSFAAYNVVDNLKIVTRERKLACLMTIHQPSYKAFLLLDRVILLTRGAVYFCGPPEAAMEWFEQLGHPVPMGANPADHYIQIAEAFEKTREAEARVIGLITSWAEKGEAFVSKWTQENSGKVSPTTLAAMSGKQVEGAVDASTAKETHERMEHKAGDWPTPWIFELGILMSRNFLQVKRDPALLIGTIGQTIALLIIIGFAFFRLDPDQGGVLARVGVLFIVPVNSSFAVTFPVLTTFPLQRAVMTRERSAGLYRTSSAYLAKLLVEIPNQIGQRLLFYVIIYWMIGLKPEAGAFFIFVGINLLQCLTALGIGFMIGGSVSSIAMGNIFAPLINVVFLLFGSQLLPTNAIPDYFVWLRWISPISYTFSGLALNEFEGQMYTCGGSTDGGSQCYTTGEQVISAYGLGRFSVGADAGFLILLTGAFLSIGYAGLRFGGHPKFRY